MKNKMIIGLFLLCVVMSSALALAPGSSDSNGAVKDIFTTDESVYFTNKASAICGDSIISKTNVTVYVIPQIEAIDEGYDLESVAVASAAVYIDENSKIQSTVIWETPEAGEWDIVLDINDDGKYDTECPDQIDDILPAGFLVEDNGVAETPANDTVNDTANETIVNDTVVEETPEEPVAEDVPVVEEIATTEDNSIEQTKSTGLVFGGTDYTPVTILAISIFVATGIIVWTLRSLR